MTKQYKQLIGGKWVDSVSGETFESKTRRRVKCSEAYRMEMNAMSI